MKFLLRKREREIKTPDWLCTLGSVSPCWASRRPIWNMSEIVGFEAPESGGVWD